MSIRHLHLPGLTRYAHAAALQERLVATQLAYKAHPTTKTPPPPIILTAQFHPVYTCGRREIGSVSASQQAHLIEQTPHGRAEFHEALRGGQTTFHGPGQLIAYPILDLRRHRLTPRDYVCLLEKTIIKTCAHYGLVARSTENPGVWVSDDEKICAVGVHLRRHITSHGIGLNVSTELDWFERIVACGLEGKRTTSLKEQGVGDVTVEQVATVFTRLVSESLVGVEGVVTVVEDEID